MIEIKENTCELTTESLFEEFRLGFKPREEFKIGMEYERLPLLSNNKMADYSSENGMYDLLRALGKFENWEYLTDDFSIIGVKNNQDRITLEPGCQLELSIEPQETLHDLKSKIDRINKKINPVLNKMGLNLVNYGVSPLSTYKHINLIPKKRYHIMANYLWGILSDVMMRETAGIQICIDFSSEEDAMRKFILANKISPFMTALFANSPIRGGVETGYKSFRALSWLNTDNERCGFAGKKIFDKKSDYRFSDYIQNVLKTPMIFINRDNPVEVLGRINFEEFIKNGYKSLSPNIEDFRLHSNLCFPDVRLRNFIEIRNHDCVGHGLQYALAAIYKGIFYNESAMSAVLKLLDCYSYGDFMEFRYNVPRCALNLKIAKTDAFEIAKEILRIAQSSLKEAGLVEEDFLEPILELVADKLCPADVIIKNWHGPWRKDVSKLIKYVSG